MDALTDTSSPASIYHVCATYRCLYSLHHLRPVAKLISCITSHNHTHKFATLDAAFNDHRLLVDRRPRQSTTPASKDNSLSSKSVTHYEPSYSSSNSSNSSNSNNSNIHNYNNNMNHQHHHHRH